MVNPYLKDSTISENVRKNGESLQLSPVNTSIFYPFVGGDGPNFFFLGMDVRSEWRDSIPEKAWGNH